MSFRTNGTTHATIDSSGRLLLGNSSSVSVTGGERQFQIQGTNGVTSSITVRRSQNSGGAPSLSFAKDRGSVSTAVSSGDSLGIIYFAGSDGTDLNNDAAFIAGAADGAPSSNNTPGRLVFATNGGSTGSIERMRIDSVGTIGVGVTPNSLHTSYKGIQVQNSLWFTNNTNFSGFTQNAYYDGAYKYTTNGEASLIRQIDGRFDFLNAASGTADAAITWSTPMRITNAGKVGIGETAPDTPLHIRTANTLGSTFTGSTRGEGVTVQQISYTSGNYISLIEGQLADASVPTARIGVLYTGSGSTLTFGTSNNYGTGITNTALTIDPSSNVAVAGQLTINTLLRQVVAGTTYCVMTLD